MKKILLTILMFACLFGTAQASNRFGDLYHEVQIVDENGEDVTDITALYIYLAGTTTNATIYSDKNRQNTITIPMTEASANTTLVDGRVSWWGPDLYDFSMTNTDGVGPRTNSGHRDRSSNEGSIQFPSYLQSISSTSYTDAQSITMGTGAVWVINGTSAGTLLSFVPGADNSTVSIGTSGTTLNAGFNVYMGTGIGLKINSTGPTFTWDGGIANINVSSNFATNINTGSSTGAVNIGNAAGGAVAIDTDAGITILADDASSIKTSAGTLLIEVTGGDFTIDCTDASLILDSGEATTDAVNIDAAAGGLDVDVALSLTLTSSEETADAVDIEASGTAGGVIVASGTGDITLDSGDDIFLAADTGTGDVISIINTQGTNAAAVIVRTVAAGSIDIDSGDNITVDVADDFTVDTADGGINFIADGGTNGDIDADAEDDMTLTTGDDMTLTVGGDLIFAVTGDTTLPNDMLLKATVAISDTEMDNLAATPIELVAAVAGNTIEFVSAIFALDWATTAWTEPSAPDDLVIRYTNTTGAIVSHLLDATGFATATEDTVAFLGSNVSDAAGADVASVAVTEANSTNKGLFLHNTGSEWTASGDSQVVVITYYRLHTTAELGL